MLEWQNTGRVCLGSQDAGKIVTLRYRTNGMLFFSLLLEPARGRWEYLKQMLVRLEDMGSVVAAVRFRLFHQIIREQRAQ